ncbi:hypothetical protein HY382_01240 [Candidatus Curtissbacteria bacterium]|nr:hypothetical protein [Candidatus Curtissbacteria bacterium]
MENLAQSQEVQTVNPLRSAPKKNILAKFFPALIIVFVVLLGAATGLVVSSRSKSEKVSQVTLEEENLTPEKKEEFQVVTRDQAEGTLEKNDKFEETAQGQWKLIRPGGENQTAYLTSSFIDLDEYVGEKVRVFGETLGSSKVGWLLDVAKVETL